MSVRGVGIDLCEIRRMADLAENAAFLERYFTAEERAYLSQKGLGKAQTLAGLFAAKEAVTKALGSGIAFPLKEIEIGHTAEGQPAVRLTGRAAELAQGGEMLVSISHEGGMAAAVALWETAQGLALQDEETGNG